MNNETRYSAHTSKFNRDLDGLLAGIDYKFKEDGSIDWMKMVDPKHLYPNEEVLRKKGKDIPSDSTKLEDDECIISLAGLKQLLFIRGYESSELNVQTLPDNTVVAGSTIKFIPNYETSGFSCVREDYASVSPSSLEPEFASFSHSIACNRALARNIRGFLNIHVVSREELNGGSSYASPDSADASSQTSIKSITPFNLVSQLNLSLDEIKELCRSCGAEISSLGELETNTILCRKILGLAKKTKK